MADRFTINRRFQIGVESTPGTAVPATKQLKAMRIEAGPKPDVAQFKGSGHRFNNVTAENTEHTEGKATIQPTYTELVYPFSGLWGAAAITTPGGGTTSRDWKWTPALTGSIARKAFTIEDGDAVRGANFAGATFTDFELDISRKATSATANLIGGLYTDAFTMTTGLPDVGLVPILGKHISLYMDTTSGGIGVTQLTRPFKGKFKYGPGYSPIWTMDRSQTSYADVADADPKAEFELTLGADSVGMGLLANLRAGDVRYIRIECVGNVIESSLRYQLVIDMAATVVDFPMLQDEQGVVAAPVVFAIQEDGNWNQAFSATLRNTLTAL